MNRRSASAVLMSALFALAGSTSVARAADPPHSDTPAPSAAEQAAIDQKQAIAHDWMLVKQGQLTASAFASAHPAWAGVTLADTTAQSDGVVSPTAESGALGLSETPQYTNYACGEASAYEILRYLKVTKGPGGETLSQPHLGAKCTTGYLCTETMSPKETPWYIGSSYPDAGGYPMRSTLNKWAATTWYVTQVGHQHDTSLTVADYTADLVLDIDNAHPVAIDVYEQANTGPHLVKHPTNKIILHYVAAYGYDSSGATTMYADSVHGVPTSIISWAAAVPAYSPFSNSSMFTLFSPFGYTW